MAKSGFEKLKELPPEERIKKLKEIEEESKKEIEKAHKLLKTSEEELEMKKEEKRKIPIPQLRSIDIDALFSQEEKDLFKVKRFIAERKKEEEVKEKPLEQTVAETQLDLTPEQVQQIQVEYGLKRDTEMANIYNRVRDIYNQAKETGYVSPDQMKQLTAAVYAIGEKQQDMQTGNYPSAGENVMKQIGVVYEMKKKLEDRWTYQSR